MCGEKRNICRLLARKLEEGRQIERPRRKWGNSIKMSINEIGREGLEWIDLAQDWYKQRGALNTVMKFQFPENAGNFLSS
jgi:hypothetical protein